MQRFKYINHNGKIYVMKLYKDFFDKIKSGNKSLELRVADFKRKQIKVGDWITFSCIPEEDKNIVVEVKYIWNFDTLEEIIKGFHCSDFGFTTNEELEIKIKEIYTEEQIMLGFVICEIALKK